MSKCVRCSKEFEPARRFAPARHCSRACQRAANGAKGIGWATVAGAAAIAKTRKERVAQLAAERPPCPCGRGPCMLSHPICGQCFQEKGAQP